MKIARQISDDNMLSENEQIHCRGKLRDDPILNLAMAINGFICNAKPKEGKCIFLPSKYTISKIDAQKGVLDVIDKNDKKINDCTLVHFSTRKALEEGLYLWQCTLISLLYKNKNSVLYKLLNNSVIEILFSFYRYVITRLKRIIGYRGLILR